MTIDKVISGCEPFEVEVELVAGTPFGLQKAEFASGNHGWELLHVPTQRLIPIGWWYLWEAEVAVAKWWWMISDDWRLALSGDDGEFIAHKCRDGLLFDKLYELADFPIKPNEGEHETQT